MSSVASAFGSIHSALHSSALTLVAELLILFAIVLWLGLGFRVHRDARRRIDDGFLAALATLLGFAIPFLGPVVYVLFRPPETLEEMRARKVEMLALRDHVGRKQPVCSVCRTEVEEDYLVCPVCTTRLKQQCVSCEAALDPLWQVCPYCTAPISAPVVETLQGFVDDLDAALTAETAVHGARVRRRSRPDRPVA